VVAGALAPVLDAATGLPAFETVLRAQGTQQSIAIDRADAATDFLLEPLPNGGFANLGAYGGTEQAALSPAQYVLVTDPQSGDFVQLGDSIAIDWRSDGFAGTVDIAVSLDGGPFVDIATAEANDGSFTWDVPAAFATGSYRVRVAATGLPAVAGVSQAFDVVPPISLFYVNDGVTEGDQYTTAAGDAANDGLTPDTPIDSLRRLLETYDLGPGDIVLIDDGSYALTANIELTEDVSGNETDGRFIVRGPTAPGAEAVFDRGATASGARVLDISGSFITVENLTLASGYIGVELAAAAQNVELRNLDLHGTGQDGIEVAAGSNDHLFENLVVWDTSYGLDLNGSGSLLRGGLFTRNALGADIETGNTVEDTRFGGNTTGLWSTGTDLDGVFIFANTANGATISGGTLTDATVYDNRSGYGVHVSGTRVQGGQFYGNATGIHAEGSTRITGAQVFDNTIGARLNWTGTTILEDSRIYDNLTTQIMTSNVNGAYAIVRNNLIYGDGATGVHVTGGQGNQIVNNTFLIGGADAVSFTNGYATRVESNVFSQTGERVLNIAEGVQTYLTSDTNLFHLTGGAEVGRWGSLDLATLSDWFYATGRDRNSRIGDPGLADPAGADGVLGWDTGVLSATVIDDGDAGYADTGGTLVADKGRGGALHRIAPGGMAEWSFTGLSAGEAFEVWATWEDRISEASRNSVYEVWDGTALVARRVFNQYNTPGTVLAGETGSWASIGTVVPTGDTLTVRLTGGADGRDAIADAVRLEQLAGNGAADDDFTTDPIGPARDGGALDLPFYGELAPNGGRADIGADGGTFSAASSADPSLQILGPGGFDKLEVGEVAQVSVLTHGLGTLAPVALIDLGGDGIVTEDMGAWSADKALYVTDGRTSTVKPTTFTDPTLPTELFDASRYSYSAGGTLTLSLPELPDGTYTLRLHGWTTHNTPGGDAFDIAANGTLLQSDVSWRTLAGARNTTAALELTVTVAGGQGLTLDLTRKGSGTPVFAALELWRPVPGGVTAPLVDIEASTDDGATWTRVASAVPVDAWGRARVDWTPDAAFADSFVRLRAVSGSATGEAGAPVLIGNNGSHFYINDAIVNPGDITTAPGNDANSGKTADSPMASLSNLLEAYDLAPGDVVHIDDGVYDLTRDIVITEADGGDALADVSFVGPGLPGKAAIFDRGSRVAAADVFEIDGADHITISNLTLRNSENGIRLFNGVEHVTLDALTFNDWDGTAIADSADGSDLTIRDALLDNAAHTSSGFGMALRGDRTQVIGGELTNIRNTGINVYNSADDSSVTGTWFHHNNGISLGANAGLVSDILVENNTTAINTGSVVLNGARATGLTVRNNSGTGAYIHSNILSDSTFTGNGIGVQAATASQVLDSTFIDNVQTGIVGGFNFSGQISGNEISGSPTGIYVNTANSWIVATLRNNLIFGPEIRTALKLQSGADHVVENNTLVLGPLGEVGFDISSNINGMTLRNNLVRMEAGVALQVADTSQTGFVSDYNLFDLSGGALAAHWGTQDFATPEDFFYATGHDGHSLTAPAGFVDAAAGDLHLIAGAAGVDAGDPGTPFFTEPGPNGGRVDIGAYGNTVEATTSAAPLVQVIHLNGGEKLETGNAYDLEFHAADLMRRELVLSMAARDLTETGSDGVEWTSGRFYKSGGTNANLSATSLAGTDHPEVPAAFYATGQYIPGAAADPLRFELPVTEAGSYTLRLHGLNVSNTVESLSVIVNGVERASGLSFRDKAGARYHGTSFDLTGLSPVDGVITVEMSNTTGAGSPMLAGLELFRENPSGLINPLFDIEISTDAGASWVPVAGAVGLDRAGFGHATWVAGPETPGATGLVRVTQAGGGISDVSDAGFLIANDGRDFYVNDSDLTGDVFTTATGDNRNSGKTPDAPMADLGALIRAYDLEPGDRVWVDAGAYIAAVDILMEEADSGDALDPVTITGAGAGLTVLTRDSVENSSEHFDFRGADHVTVADMTLAAGSRGVYLASNAGSDGITLTGLEFRDQRFEAVEAQPGNTGLTLIDVIAHDTSLASAGEYALYLNTGDTRVIGGTLFDNARALYLAGADALAEGVEVYGTQTNSSAVYLRAGAVMRDSILRDNAGTGADIDGDARLETSAIFDNDIANVYLGRTGTVADSTIYGGPVGVNAHGGLVEGNRIFANDIGIDGYSSYSGLTTVLRNQIYSNAFGVQTGNGIGETWVLRQNLIYGNANAAVDIGSVTNFSLFGNTLVQASGPAILVSAGNANVTLRNNILESSQGAIIDIDSGGIGFDSDFNLFHAALPAVNIGDWVGTPAATLLDWQGLAGEGAGSIVGDPVFLDRDGADNVLGQRDGPLGGGADDNYTLFKESPAIDAGTAYDGALLSDYFDRPRSDDPSTPNSGAGYDRFVETADTQPFPQDGTAITALNSGQNRTTDTLPFTFSFYGTEYTEVTLTTEGFLQFSGSVSYASSEEQFLSNPIIAPFWSNLSTAPNQGAGYGVFRSDAADGHSVTYRWKGRTIGTDAANEVNFAVTLHDDGRIAFHYGAGNIDDRNLIGISSGNGYSFVYSALNGGQPVDGDYRLLTPTPGLVYFDIGAFEFQGDSGDVVPPTVTHIPQLPPPGGTTALAFTALTVETSEALELVSARSPANYELRGAGADGLFDTVDDVLIGLSPAYSFPETNLTLSFGAPLPDGDYRLTLSGTLAIYDTAGNRLDGDGDGTGGDDYIRLFTIDRSTNTLPEALDTTETVAEDGSVDIQLSASDSDGDTLRYEIVTPPVFGTLENFDPATGMVTYRPDPDETRSDSITFAVDDGKLGRDTAVVTVNVVPENDAPTAAAASFEVIGGAPTRIVLGGSDVETAPGALGASIVSAPSVGTLIPLPAEGPLVFLYTAPAEFDGTTSFTFAVTDTGDPAGTPGNALSSSPATVTLNVTPGNTAPRFDPLADQVITEGATLNLDLAAFATDPEGHGLTFSLVSGPAWVSVTPEGLLSFAAPNTAGDGTVTVRATDDGPGALSGEASFALSWVNAAPTAGLAGPDSVDVGQPLTVAPSATDPGGDAIASWRIDWGDGIVEELSGALATLEHSYDAAGDVTLSLTAIDTDGAESAPATREVSVLAANVPPEITDPAPMFTVAGKRVAIDLTAHAADIDPLTFVLTAAGHPDATVTPEGLFSWDIPADADGVFDFAVEVDDGRGGTAPMAFTIDVTNRKPVWTRLPPQVLSAPQIAVLDLSAYVIDPDGGAITGYTLVSSTLAGVTLDPKSGLLTLPAPDESVAGRHLIKVAATDEAGQRRSAGLRVDIDYNRPSWEALPRQYIATGDSFALDLTRHISDPDGDALSFAIAESSVAGLTIDAAGLLTGTIAPGTEAGRHDIVLTATDATGLTARRTLQLDVDYNRPSWAKIPRLPTASGEAIAIPLADYVNDPDGLGPMTYRIVSSAVAGLVVDPATGMLSGTLAADTPAGRHDIVVAVMDATGLEAQRRLWLDVDYTLPVWQSVPFQHVVPGDGLSLDLSRYVSDPDGAGPLTFALVSSEIAGAAVDPETGLLTATVTPGTEAGRYTVVVSASDATGLERTRRLTVQVNDEIPGLNRLPVLALSAGDALSFDLSGYAHDPAGTGLTFALVSSAIPGMSVDPVSGLLTGTVPEDLAAGRYDIYVSAEDATGSITRQRLRIDVDYERPIWSRLPNQSVTAGTAISLSLGERVSDPNAGEALTFSISESDLAGFSIDAATGALSGVVAEDTAAGTYRLRIAATDASGLTSRTTLRIDVDTARPRFLPIEVLDASAGETATLALADAVFDPAGAGPLTFGLVSSEVGGVSVDSATGLMTLTVAPDAVGGRYDIVVSVTDANGSTSKGKIRVDLGYNRPVWSNVARQVVSAGDTISVALADHVTDPDGPGALSFAIAASDLAGLTVDPDSGELTGTVPPETPDGLYKVKVTATDALGLARARTLIILVGYNRPVIDPLPRLDIAPGADLSLMLADFVTDPDGPEGLTYGLESSELAGIGVDAATGAISGSLAPDTPPGSYAITVSITDPTGLTGTARLDVTVPDVAPPVAPLSLGGIDWGDQGEDAAAPLLVLAASVPDPSVRLSVGAASLGTDAETEALEASFVVSLDAPATEPVSFSYSFEAGGAAQGHGEAIIPVGRSGTILRRLIDPLQAADWDSLTLRVYGLAGAALAGGGFQAEATLLLVDRGDAGLDEADALPQGGPAIEWS
jgi:hypothetical protein